MNTSNQVCFILTGFLPGVQQVVALCTVKVIAAGEYLMHSFYFLDTMVVESSTRNNLSN